MKELSKNIYPNGADHEFEVAIALFPPEQREEALKAYITHQQSRGERYDTQRVENLRQKMQVIPYRKTSTSAWEHSVRIIPPEKREAAVDLLVLKLRESGEVMDEEKIQEIKEQMKTIPYEDAQEKIEANMREIEEAERQIAELAERNALPPSQGHGLEDLSTEQRMQLAIAEYQRLKRFRRGISTSTTREIISRYGLTGHEQEFYNSIIEKGPNLFQRIRSILRW